MSGNRKLDVLRAIVTEYVHTREPVGSKAIAQSHDLGVSSATIRNDMALLEEAELIYQPHTSAGRIPTDKGYRVFVDSLSQLKPLSPSERSAVEAFLSQSVDLDDVVTRTVRLLAQVTHQVAVVEYPVVNRQKLRRIEVVDLSERRLLVIVVTCAGRVNEKTLDFSHDIDPATIATVRQRLNDVLSGRYGDEMPPLITEAASSVDESVRSVLHSVGNAVVELARPSTDSRIVLSGISNLARGALDFHDIAPVLDALEEQVVLLRLFSQLSQDDEDVQVRIGAENDHDALAEAAVVAGTYRASMAAGQSSAHLGVVGPTRMDYARTMASVRAVAAYLSRFLNR